MRVVMSVCILLLLLLLLAACVIERPLNESQRQLTHRLNELLPKIAPAYFTVLVHQRGKTEAGSGFAVSGSGYVLTAGHVAMTVGNTVKVRGLKQRIYTGKVVAISQSPDIALLKLESLNSDFLQPLAPNCIDYGAPIFSLGNPKFGVSTVRVGTLMSLHHEPFVSPEGFGYSNAIQLSLATQVGESGGPVLNENGLLVGMIVTGSPLKNRGQSSTQALSATVLAQFMCTKIPCTKAWAGLTTPLSTPCDS